MGLSIDTFRYFSHDADMRNDIKIKALRRKFGATGYAVWCFILETLTDKEDFEIEYTTIEQELMAADFDITVEELQEIVDYCVKVNLLQQEDERLFSNRHKERLFDVIEKKERKRAIAKKAIASRWNKSDKETNDESNTNVIHTNNEGIATNREDKNRINREEEIRIEKIVYPYADITSLWNNACKNLPKVIKLNDNRRQKIKCRFEEFGCKTVEEAMDFYRALIEKIAVSDFLNGNNNQGWTATFDWLFENAKNWVKVAEGNYDNKRGAKSSPNSAANNLGVGEYIDNNGRRTYGTGKADIPSIAPPRPSEQYIWDSQSQTWITL